MNAHALAAAAYGGSTPVHKPPRAAEYDVISQITARIRSAQNAKPFVFAKLAEALFENRRLWVELAVDLANPDNALPQPLRVQLLGLAQFTLRHTDAVLTGTETPDALIDINVAIMRGLASKAEAP